MSVLVYIETPKGNIKKQGQELAFYGAQHASNAGVDCVALVIGQVNDPGSLGLFGIKRVIQVNENETLDFDSQVYTDIIAKIAAQEGATTIAISHSSNGKALLGRLSVKLEAGSVSGVTSLPDLSNGFVVTKSVFSGKAVAHYNIETPVRVISLMGNSIQLQSTGSPVSVEKISVDHAGSKVKVIGRKTSEGIVPLPEAELVVSAGRGMKGPENWGIVEELSDALGATTACSRPVADSDWRPHHEHVGQTGVAIRPNLYIAIGISGAIQHLAGVNNSKTIVVINKDAEAPFFKAADYGVVGDLFDVVPKLTAAIQKFKQHS
ncbi:MAG: electron transfer flavoprotein subunit alpha/FixB family protein [Saprospiraceae bacterium]|nr:electron transfer flavoprotein subunit alpha/FixB family protein [Saprospiraceae bacterium]